MTSVHLRRFLSLAALIAAAVCAAAVCAATVVQSQDAGSLAASKEWATVNGDLANTRYSALTRINKDTVGMLGGAWMAPKFDAPGAGRAMPVVKNGALFITGGASVYAYDAKTGAKVWQYSTDRQPATAG